MGVGAWVGYPRSWTAGRLRALRFIVIHFTAGSEGPRSAEDGAAYDKTRTDGVSCHAFVDSNSIAVEVPPTDRAHHARQHGNEIGYGIEICGTMQTRAQWLDAVSLPTLRNAARQAAEVALAYGIPVMRLSVAQTRAAYYAAEGQRPKGFCGHVDVTAAFPEDQGTHTDPGTEFPWDVFFSMVIQEMTAQQGEQDMALTAQQEADLMKAVTLINQHGDALVWRTEAIINDSPTVTSGVAAGQLNQLHGALSGIKDQLTALGELIADLTVAAGVDHVHGLVGETGPAVAPDEHTV